MEQNQDFKRFMGDTEFRQLSPPLSTVERETLESILLRYGSREPVFVWGEILLDGYERYEICIERQLPFLVQEVQLHGREEAVRWICAAQLNRRYLPAVMRKYLIGRLYEAERMIGTRVSGGESAPGHSTNDSPGQQRIQTQRDMNGIQRQMKSRYGLCLATLQRYLAFAHAVDRLAEAEPGIVRKILSGELKIPLKNFVTDTNALRELGESQGTINTVTLYGVEGRPKRRNRSPKRREPPRGTVQLPAVKIMPSPDPDGEYESLILTIPSWISSIEHVTLSAQAESVTEKTKSRLIGQLNRLSHIANSLLESMEV